MMSRARAGQEGGLCCLPAHENRAAEVTQGPASGFLLPTGPRPEHLGLEAEPVPPGQTWASGLQGKGEGSQGRVRAGAEGPSGLGFFPEVLGDLRRGQCVKWQQLGVHMGPPRAVCTQWLVDLQETVGRWN